MTLHAEVLGSLKQERKLYDTAINALEAMSGPLQKQHRKANKKINTVELSTAAATPTNGHGNTAVVEATPARRRFSAQARKRMSLAMKRRWRAKRAAATQES